MEKMKNLKDLLLHEILDLYSAEEQIIEAMPLMINKAKDKKLVSALTEHLKITEVQKARLDEIKQLMQGETGNDTSGEEGGNTGFFSNFFGSSDTKQVCRGMQGLIEEGQKVMGEDMDPKVLDAAIIACAQKIEHYEICGYGTARAYARELNLGEVAERLEETLDEEYEADDLLTDLAVGGLNEEAEMGGRRSASSRSGRSASGEKSKGNSRAAAKKSGPKKSASKKSASKKSAPKKASSRKSASNNNLPTNKSKASGASRARNAGGSKGKSGASRGSKSRGR
jgi:ferritin-like metal-binding protein YciE